MNTAISSDMMTRRTRRVLIRICDRGLKLTTAESCTGGLIAALVTDIEGCSHAFERGFVVYTDAAKHEVLGVSREMLRRCGAVSAAVAIAMAEGALHRSDADIAVSVTGYAGPSAEGGEEGRVHFALARQDGETLHREEGFGPLGRDPIRQRCLETVLDMLEDIVA
ncbi:CinA family protein [Celeribacter indicus]|uniref:CinA domain-containing protein n=1 Tax=Celeribacter indicus TaxID=1208324 RepID=A0A0B5DYI4_9RHOB|nr:CinA family protein [Celeribacter indicus]AJE45786.1 CinA domain-containing protein [Celeribacter indicus]SDW60618.1 nicotinamide-nucleotide amidase [Celeribacter indicus]